MRVLIAEDDAVVRTVLIGHLTQWGHDVIACSDGAEAWRAMQEEGSPRLVLLDWIMPEMDGLSICRGIRNLNKDPYVYIILLTGKSERKDIVEGLKAGADDYIIKPFAPEELHVRINGGVRILDLYRRLVLTKTDLEKANEGLREALSEVKKLSGLLPICASCKKIRDDKGYWQQLESYISTHSEAMFSHGICPECAKELYPGLFSDAREYKGER